MQYRDEEELFSIGVAVASPKAKGHDTTSDASDWVLQYTDWEEGGPRFECIPHLAATSRVGPVFQSFLPKPARQAASHPARSWESCGVSD